MAEIGVSGSTFSGDSTIFKVYFGSQCSYISDNAFQNCTTLKEINANNNINTIGVSAFANNSALTNVIFNNVSSIGSYAFQNCSSLSSISLGNVSSIESYAFQNCISLSSISLDNISSIESYTFQSCKLSEVKLSKCETVEECAFDSNESLKKIYFYNCTKIGENAFANCTKLSDVYIYNSNEKICTLSSSYPFSPSVNLNYSTDFKIHVKADVYNVYIISSYWSDYYDQITPIYENHNITYISNEKTELTLNNGIENQVVKNTYISDKNIGILTFKSEITSLTQLFTDEDQKQLLKIENIPTTCTEITKDAFKNCINLNELDINKNITSVAEGFLRDCEIIGNNIKGKFVYGSENTTKYIVYNNTLIYVSPVFGNDKPRIHKISEMTDGKNNITKLGDYCFNNCKDMVRVEIPSSVTHIGDCVFKGCENLYEIHFSAAPPKEIGSNIFEGVKEGFKIFVPNEYLTNYNNKFSRYDICPKPADDTTVYYNTTKDKTFNSVKYEEFNPVNKSEVNKVILGEGIKIIKENAFKGYENLEYIYLSDNITELQSDCFYNCKKLTRIHIPNNLNQKIYPNVFYNCTNLKEFGTYYTGKVSKDNRCYIQNGVLIYFAPAGLKTYKLLTDIEIKEINEAFRETSILSLDMDTAQVNKINDYAFYNCINLQSFISNNNLKTIGDCAFMNCYSLQYVYLPDSLTTIGKSTFSNCENLSSVTLPNTLTTINKNAFQGCTNLQYVSLPNSLTTIDEFAFNNCDNLSSMTLPNTLTTINKNAFQNCYSLKYVSLPDSLTTIGDYAFNGCSKIHINNIPNNVTTIGGYAFQGCNEFKCGTYDGEIFNEVPLNLNIKTINVSTFESCKNLSNVSISSVNTINTSAFQNCKNLQYVSLPNSLTTISDYAFERCESLNYIFLPNSLTTIGDYAFNGCSKIYINNIPNNVTTIGDYAFQDCSEFKCGMFIGDNFNEVPLNLNNVTTIGDYAFRNCTGYTNELILKENLMNIGRYCFANCGITSLTINKNNIFDTIPQHAFEGCENLKSVDFIFNDTTVTKSGLDIIEIKQFIISENAFNGCKSLIRYDDERDYYINLNNTKKIGDHAFDGCSIGIDGDIDEYINIIITSKVEELGNKCFTKNKQHIYIEEYRVFENMIPIFTTNDSNFEKKPFGELIGIDRKIYFKKENVKDAYEENEDWKIYKNDFEIKISQ